MSNTIDKNLVDQCRNKLVEAKDEIINRVESTRTQLNNEERGGDEADQTVRTLAEGDVLRMVERLRTQLVEVEMALGRIENGTYGVCEETEEFIEAERLLAIPWTRLSIEGAEIRESMKKRFAR